MSAPVCTQEEFHQRFKAAMMKAGPEFDNPEAMAAYAEDMWRSYWEDQGQDGETPEDCAGADLGEWGEE